MPDGLSPDPSPDPSQPPIYLIGPDVPDVPECYGKHERRLLTTTVNPGSPFGQAERWRGLGMACSQCDGGHAHEWVVCVRPVVINGRDPEQVVRCLRCGARACQYVAELAAGTGCLGRRHHSDPHIYPDGRVERVGA